jgi:TPR repeat protein
MALTAQNDYLSNRLRTRARAAVSCIKVLVLCLLIGGCTIEDRRADKAYQRGEYSKTVKELRYLAENGDLRAQYDLGVLYDRGEGVPQDNQEALNWYHRAAEEGEARAQYNLGLMYANGQGVTQDYAEAYYWITLAVAQGNVHAVEAGDYYSAKMTPDQMARAKQLLELRARRVAQPQPCPLSLPCTK